MSRGLDETVSSTDELMEVDTTFLDAYRAGGSDGLRRTQERVQRSPAEQDAPDRDGSAAARARSADHHDARSGPGQRGGSGASAPPPSSQGEPVTREDADDLPDAALDDHEPEPRPLARQDEDEQVPPVPLQHTDHQEAVQSAAARGGSGGGGDGGSDALPQTGFRLSGVKSQPAVRALPEAVVTALREQLRSAAVRELAVSDATAREFAERLSQAALVTAFLLAQLDLGLVADPATRRAAQLFRSRDPLLGSIAKRLEDMEQLERDRADGMARMREQLAEVKETGDAIEQAVAYSIADRTSNFLRGSHNVHDAPITHKDAIFVRDRVREATRRQTKLEREREGRPIR
jgi:hypothetical protein